MPKYKPLLAAALTLVVCAAPSLAQQTPPTASARVAPAAAQPSPDDRRREAFEIVWRTVKETHFDPTFGGLDWDAVRTEFAPRAAAARTDAELHWLLQQMLNRLGQSHFTIIPPESIPPPPADEDEDEGDDEGDGDEAAGEDSREPTPEQVAAGERLSHGIGIDVRILDGQVVITRVQPDSPAARAGLRTGYVVRSVDGRSVRGVLRGLEHAAAYQPALRHHLPAELLVNYFNGPDGSLARLSYTDARGRLRRAAVRRARLSGELAPPFQSLPAQFYEFETRRLRGRIGYIRFDMFAAPVLEKFCAALRSMSDAPGLVIDLRGNRGGLLGLIYGMGGLLVERPASFGVMRMRGAAMEFRAFPQRRPYTGQVVVLIDRSSASASEIFAGGLQESGRALLVGEPSAGMTLPSTAKELPTGAVLQYAIADFETARSRRLEGVGLKPDVEVRLDRRTLLAGRDAQLEAALDAIYLPDAAGAADPSPRHITRDAEAEEDAAPSAAAETAQEAEALRVVERYEEAVGGRAAFEKLSSRVSKGRFEGTFADARITGTAEILERAPDRSVTLIDLPALGRMRRGYTGAYAYEQVPMFGFRELRGAEGSMVRLTSDLRWPARLRELYPRLAVKGTELVGDLQARVVEATPARGRPALLYFDVLTGLLLRRDDTFFEDYREVDGVLLPFTIRTADSRITLTEVRHNLPLDDSRFAEQKDCLTQEE